MPPQGGRWEASSAPATGVDMHLCILRRSCRVAEAHIWGSLGVPCFIDRHRVADVDPAARYQMYLEALQGLRDVHGAKPLSHWIEDGTIYCVLDAPDEEAVCQHHAS